MLHVWDAIEADFLRDYGIRLVERLDDMTWRFFLVLVNNLSPWGMTAAKIAEEQKKPEEDELSERQAADAFFAAAVSISGNKG